MTEEQSTTESGEIEQLVSKNRELIDALKRLSNRLRALENEQPGSELMEGFQETPETKGEEQ